MTIRTTLDISFRNPLPYLFPYCICICVLGLCLGRSGGTVYQELKGVGRTNIRQDTKVKGQTFHDGKVILSMDFGVTAFFDLIWLENFVGNSQDSAPEISQLLEVRSPVWD